MERSRSIVELFCVATFSALTGPLTNDARRETRELLDDMSERNNERGFGMVEVARGVESRERRKRKVPRPCGALLAIT
jgi:hypothetical protein